MEKMSQKYRKCVQNRNRVCDVYNFDIMLSPRETALGVPCNFFRDLGENRVACVAFSFLVTLTLQSVTVLFGHLHNHPGG